MPNISNSQHMKALKQEFLQYLDRRIPSYRMPASTFFSSINTALKKFAKQQGHDVSSLLEIDDLDLLIVWQGKLANNSNYVYNPRRQETKTQEGLRYYIDFLRNILVLI